jgi:hypothetical protein
LAKSVEFLYVLSNDEQNDCACSADEGEQARNDCHDTSELGAHGKIANWLERGGGGASCLTKRPIVCHILPIGVTG